MISLLIALSCLISLSFASAVETCVEIAPCLNVSYDYVYVDGNFSAKVCVTYDSTADGCIKGGLDANQEPEAISHACGGDCTSEFELADDYCKVEEMAPYTSICNTKSCDFTDPADQFIEFGFKDGEGCGGADGVSNNNIYLSGVFEGGVTQCRPAVEGEDVLCGGGNNDECIFSIPYSACPSPDPTVNPTKSPTKSPTLNPSNSPTTADPTLNPSVAPTKLNKQGCLAAAELIVDSRAKARAQCNCQAFDENGKIGQCACLNNCGSGSDCDSAKGNICNNGGAQQGVCCCSPFNVVSPCEFPTASAAMNDGNSITNSFGLENGSPGQVFGIWFVIIIGAVILVVGAAFVGIKMMKRKGNEIENELQAVVQTEMVQTPTQTQQTEIEFEVQDNSDSEIP